MRLPHPQDIPPRAQPASHLEVGAWVMHALVLIGALTWLTLTYLWQDEKPFTPTWVMTLWVLSFLGMTAGAWWPWVMLVIYGLLSTVIARYEPGVEPAMNTDVLFWICGLALTATCIWCVRNRVTLAAPRHWRLITWTMLSLLVWIGITSAVAYLRYDTWHPEPGHHPRNFIPAAILFLLASQFMHSARAAVCFAIVVNVALAVRGRFLSPFGIWLQEDIASMLVICLPLGALVWTAVQSWVWRIILSLGMILVAAHAIVLLLAAQNRGSLLALAAMVPVAILCARWRWIWAALAIPAALAAWTFLQGTQLWSRTQQLWIGGREAGSADQRMRLWEGAWAMAQDHPIVGVGPGYYIHNILQYNPAAGRAQPAHNNFLAMLSETGFPGLILYTLLFTLAIYLLIRVIRIARSDWPAPAARLLIPSLTAYLVVGLVLTRHDLAFAYLLAGWATGLYNRVLGPDLLHTPNDRNLLNPQTRHVQPQGIVEDRQRREA